MKRLPSVSLVSLALLSFTGCFSTTHVVQKTQAPDMYRSAPVEVLEQQISDRDAAIKTLTASVLITASTGGGKEGKVTEYTSFKGYIFVQKPRDLHVILQLPVVGSRALDMVSNGEHFTLLIPPKSRAITGTNEVSKPSKNGLENLRPAVFFDSLLVPGVNKDEFITLTESTRVLEAAHRHSSSIEEPDYDLAVLKPLQGNIMRRLRMVHISRVDMLPFQQDIYNEQGRVVTTATYEKYAEVNGQQFPMLINIHRPLDEYSLKIEITKLTLNDTFEADQFEVPKIPAGYSVQKME